MLNNIRRFILSIFMLCVSFTAVAAQDDAGWIRAEIDGEVMEWRLWADQSDWFGPIESPQTWISFYTYQTQEGVLPSTFRLSAYRVEDKWLGVSVDFDLAEGAGHYTSDNVGQAELDVSDTVLDGDILILKGTFTANTFFKETLSGEPDITKPLVVENVEFAVRVPPRR